jgi:hypothetical protein
MTGNYYHRNIQAFADAEELTGEAQSGSRLIE